MNSGVWAGGGAEEVEDGIALRAKGIGCGFFLNAELYEGFRRSY